MRCVCCNRNLNDYESTIKSAATGEYLDTCMSCLDGLGIEILARSDLNEHEMMDDMAEWAIDNHFGLDDE